MRNATIHLTLVADHENHEAEMIRFEKIVSSLHRSATSKNPNCRLVMPGIDLALFNITEVNASWPKSGDTCVIRIDTATSVQT
jgi:hypothetical protein